MSDSTSHQTPNEIVADKIMNRLINADLISEQDCQRTRKQLAAGSLKPEDWQLLAEKALERGAMGDNDG